MEAHGVGEARQEEVVILGSDLLHDGGEADPFSVGEIRHPLDVPLPWQDHGFVRPWNGRKFSLSF